MRSHYCGALNRANIGQEVTLSGWVHRRRDLGGLIFIDMRDRDGIVQVCFDPKYQDALTAAAGLRNEFCIQIKGEVIARPDNQINKNMATGEVEVLANDVLVPGAKTAATNNGVVLLPERLTFTKENVNNYDY